MWWEIIPPFAIMVGCITATGVGMKVMDKLFHKGKPRRYNVDDFAKRLMDRDKEITGSKYVQKGL